MPRRLTAPALLAAFVAVALAGCGQDATQLASHSGDGGQTGTLPPAPTDAPPAQIEQTPPPAKHVPNVNKGDDISEIPPASAGTNGSYDPPSAAEQKRLAARVHAPVGAEADELAIQIGGTALAPPGAPDPIKGVISAANSLVGQPYVWGGGHASYRSRGYDCSGAVSYALAGGNLIGGPATSGQLMNWGVPGKGRWLTIYAKPSHVYAVVAGLRWDTVGDAKGNGPRWHPFDAYPQGFVARHLPGL